MAETKDVTRQMIEIWDMTDTDWMGYKIGNKNPFTYHHLRVAKKNGGHTTIENGAILCGRTGHPYLHVIERYDRDKFLYLTKILIEVNDQRKMPSYEQLSRIDDVLEEFENEYSGKTNKKGHYLIRDSFEKRLVKKKSFYFFDDTL